jgi:DNA-binding CsgD family transcriptional regulator/tetratricopeptide (TPR) repeat protein/energy-coupling factor transporter ATP-binding protein EcfA2
VRAAAWEGRVVVLIEREPALRALSQALAEAGDCRCGRLVLVTGEAGAGKTSLLRAFVAGLPPSSVAVVGGCDNLRTARPLGPVLDWAAARDPDLGAAILAGESRVRVFERVLGLLQQTAVAVLEDLHWADEATLDLLSFLGRRLDRMPTVLLVTYRSDETGPAHPVSVTLGEMSRSNPLRIPVPPLSPMGVARLAEGHDVDPLQLHARTGGNPFFVAECLTSATTVPENVRDAVLARLERLGPAARLALAAVAAVPGQAELWLVDAMGAHSAAVDECVATGVLVADENRVRFRHELAREAVLGAVMPGRRQQLHRLAVAALGQPPDGPVDSARIAHHAVECGDVDALLRHAPQAAAAAQAAGARREAIAHLELALAHGHRLTAAERLELWSRLAEQRTSVGSHDEAVAAFTTAIALAEEIGDEQRQGRLLTGMWAPLSMSGDLEEAERAVARAVSLLERHPPGPALAHAYAQRSAHHMLARELPAAEPWGQSAIALAEEHGDTEVLSYALIQSGVARWISGEPDGLDRLRRGVEVARTGGHDWLVAHGLSQIGSGGGEVRQYEHAVPALEACVAYAERLDLGSRGLYAAAWLARCHVDQGRWEEGARLVSSVLGSPRCGGITRMTALTALGRLRARRGDPGVWPALDEALELARRTDHLQRTWPVVAARAEAAWLHDRLDSEIEAVDEVHATAVRLHHPWAIGELGLWLWRAGRLGQVGAAAPPYALHIGGRAAAAAASWQQLRCPYEQADALADGDDAQQLTALAQLTGLGARPAVQRLAERRRAAGRHVPRGPNAATRANPARLTEREIDVLRLVAAGCTNPEIAQHLHITPKTVGHHVSHVLAKLGARSRAEAVAAALQAGLPLTR